MGCAVVAALLGFSGWLQSTAFIVQDFFFVLVAFAFLSLLFSLFEPDPVRRSAPPLRLRYPESNAEAVSSVAPLAIRPSPALQAQSPFKWGALEPIAPGQPAVE
jgi:uncharacterized membrane protein YtjA (UPF0391 family)